MSLIEPTAVLNFTLDIGRFNDTLNILMSYGFYVEVTAFKVIVIQYSRKETTYNNQLDVETFSTWAEAFNWILEKLLLGVHENESDSN